VGIAYQNPKEVGSATLRIFLVKMNGKLQGLDKAYSFLLPPAFCLRLKRKDRGDKS
jgi:hypothetical protein